MTAKVLWVNRETGIVTVRVQQDEPDMEVGDVITLHYLRAIITRPTLKVGLVKPLDTRL